MFTIHSACAGDGRDPRQRLGGVPALYGKCEWFVLISGLNRSGQCGWNRQCVRAAVSFAPERLIERYKSHDRPGWMQQLKTKGSHFVLVVQMQCSSIHLHVFTPVSLRALSHLVSVFP